ncbi:MAG: glycosyltransferase [Psychroflexus sp.]|jgi:cellulose synthase/poly-beta-1,6-N-acetylglucosamine synthase-like glycosyltransferase|nr:glycosyltransferase [Psychroflexus sp.]MDR9448644.1 glycosyltransferase [Psychroflexus sp.]
MILLISIACISYLLLTNYIVIGLKKYQPEKESDIDNDHELTRFSVLIPCRNEAARIKSLLKSIENLQYDLNCYELIFIDDYSQDDTYEMLNQFKAFNDQLDVKLLKNNGATGKKSALSYGIDHAKYALALDFKKDLTFSIVLAITDCE